MSENRLTRAPGPRALLARILDEPELVRTVQALPARALGRIIDHVGLEDAGELVALATTEQLTQIFDQDLWSAARPGELESFDPARFSLWLEVLCESGERFAADKLAELPEELLTLALSELTLVVNLDQLMLEVADAGDEADAIEKALDGALAHEIDEYRIIARRHDGWDALVTALTALDRDHHDLLARLLERTSRAGASYVEEQGGLCEALSQAEMIESDAAAARDDRRAEEGYVPPADAAAFLKGASRTPLAEILRTTEPDPITRAYFRAYPRRPVESTGRGRTAHAGAPPVATAAAVVGGATPTSPTSKWTRLLAELDEEAPPPRALLDAGVSDPAHLLEAALGVLAERDRDVFERRREELGYLANVLLSGATLRGRAYRPFEAADAALQACNRGLAHLLGGRADLGRATQCLMERDAVWLFRMGWRLAVEKDGR